MHLRREISVSSWQDSPEGTIDAWVCNTNSVDLGRLALQVTLKDVITIEEDPKYLHVNGRLVLKQTNRKDGLLTDMHLTKSDNTGFGIINYSGTEGENHQIIDMLDRIEKISNQNCCSD